MLLSVAARNCALLSTISCSYTAARNLPAPGAAPRAAETLRRQENMKEAARRHIVILTGTLTPPNKEIRFCVLLHLFATGFK